MLLLQELGHGVLDLGDLALMHMGLIRSPHCRMMASFMFNSRKSPAVCRRDLCG